MSLSRSQHAEPVAVGQGERLRMDRVLERAGAVRADNRVRPTRQSQQPCVRHSSRACTEFAPEMLEAGADPRGHRVVRIEQAATRQGRPDRWRATQLLRLIEGAIDERRPMQRRALDLIADQRHADGAGSGIDQRELRRREIGDAK